MPWIRLPVPAKEEMDRFNSECRGKARFLVDESLGMRVAEILRRGHWNVKYVSEVGLEGHPDENVFAYAKRENRILLTHDTDFLNNRLYPLKGSPGIIVLPGAEGNVSALLNALGMVWPRFPGFYRESKTSFSEDGIVTIMCLTESGIETSRFRLGNVWIDKWIDEDKMTQTR